MNTQMKTLMSQRIFNSNTCRILFATCLSAFCLVALSVEAATLTVTNTNDSDAGSLRQAVADANDGDTINFDSSLNGQTITLTGRELLVDRSVTINGPGSNNLAVDGNHASRVFHVSGGVTAGISGLSITNGSVPGASGGGIYNDHSTLTVSNCALSGNSASSVGGGIENDGSFSGSATLEVLNCTLSGNSAYAGAGINNDGFSGTATLEVLNSTLSDNSASYYGGGIYNNGYSGSATLGVLNSTLSGNSASSQSGGGIYNLGSSSGSATLQVRNSTLSGNSTSYFGGGIYNLASYSGTATLEVLNSTLSGNSAYYGGGIFNDRVFSGSATLTIGDTILNAGALGANIGNYNGTITSLGYNLSNDDGAGFLTVTGDSMNTDPMLGALQDNGGPTFTHALLPGSPAIDAGDTTFDPYAFDPPLLYDQRGAPYARVANNRIDIGAFEAQASPFECPQPQGYWKNNPDAWPVNSLTLGNHSYLKTELLMILNTSIGSGKNADASLILADQLIAAKLNIANGSDPAPVNSTITHSDSLLSGFSGKLPYHVKPSSANGQAMVTDATVLNNYNNGALTPGCTP